MARSADREALEEARAEIDDLASSFRSALDPALRSALERRLQVFLEARPGWTSTLAPDVLDALREAARRAIAMGTEGVTERLADAELWRSPLTAPGIGEPSRPGWSDAVPTWLSSTLHRFGRRADGPRLGELDDPSNRIWVAISSAARALDPVLEEFGLPPSSTPGLGGGRYGLQPRTLAQLDPSGTLARLWRRYVLVYHRYAALERALDER